jgi:hypothetical protein
MRPTPVHVSGSAGKKGKGKAPKEPLPRNTKGVFPRQPPPTALDY